MRSDKVKKIIQNTYRRLRGEISQKELERLNWEANNPQLLLGIGAVTEPTRRHAHHV